MQGSALQGRRGVRESVRELSRDGVRRCGAEMPMHLNGDSSATTRRNSLKQRPKRVGNYGEANVLISTLAIDVVNLG